MTDIVTSQILTFPPTSPCAGSVTLNPREKLESNGNGNLILWCWRFSYWCC